MDKSLTSRLQVDRLQVSLASGCPVVDEVSLSLDQGQILGVVGESGSGKTTMSLALLGYAKPGLVLAGGSVVIQGENVLDMDQASLRQLRGRLVSYVPQDPTTALNPSLRVGAAVREMVRGNRNARAAAVVDVLERAKLPTTREFRRRYPHQLSGGQQQRLAIAMALAAQPSVVVLDEPTTGLDVMTEKHVLAEITRLRDELSAAMIYVTHDLSVVADIADRVAVMYAGRIIEEGPTSAVLRDPKHPYTRGLVTAVPDISVRRRLVGIAGVPPSPRERPSGCAFEPRCLQRVEVCITAEPNLESVSEDRSVRCFEWRATPPLAPSVAGDELTPESPHEMFLEVNALTAEHRTRIENVVAAESVSFEIARSQCIALVGESGSGKTTIARCIAGLHAPTGGYISLEGEHLAPLARQRSAEACRRIQIVFQNPADSLNPRRLVGEAIARPARLFRGLSRDEAAAEVVTLLEQVRLPPEMARRYPLSLSGGERQRVAIARALAAQPDLVICDEVTSALDVSVQAAILELLRDLRREVGVALLFISHDLGVVSSVADEVVVLKDGQVRERNATAAMLATPRDSYTRTLLEAAPRLSKT